MKTTKYTITEASKKAGISRSQFYKEYINKGIISKSKEGKKVFIDVSEFKRVFPDNNMERSKDVQTGQFENIIKTHEIELLKQELRLIKEQLEEIKKDKEYYRILAITNQNKKINKKKKKRKKK